jgi:nicotinamidase-related amidase
MKASSIPAGAAISALALFLAMTTNSKADDSTIRVHLRSRVKTAGDPKGEFKVVEKEAAWDPKKTAIIVCDMWDDHWCKGAAARVAELAKPMNELLKVARSKGIFVIDAPSSVVDFYKDTPQRKRAQEATFSKPPVPLTTAERWGTNWRWPDPKREAELPIDDSDMGCDCAVKCAIREAWKRQNAILEIAADDAITDRGQETYNLLRQRGINNVILMGVHLNMCVLGRPFAIREMATEGENVVLMRDMTDTMYNHEKRPFVSHFEGTQLVIEHVEKYWCPSITSADITGRPAFRFSEDTSSK